MGDLATFPSDTLFKIALRQLTPEGGGDCPDLALTGLNSAVDNCNSDCSVFVITDADPKDKGMLESVKKLIVTKRIQVNFILTGSCNSPTVDPVYYQIAEFSLGLVVQISKNEFSSVIPFIDRAIDHHQRHALLVVNRVQFPESNRFVFDVIENTTITEIYLSGPNVIAKVYTGGGDLMDIEQNISLSTFSVYHLRDAKPGVYLLQVESTGHTSIRVHGYAENGFVTGDDIDLRVFFEYNNRSVTQPPLGMPLHYVMWFAHLFVVYLDCCLETCMFIIKFLVHSYTVNTTLIIVSYGTHHPYELHQVQLVVFQNSVAAAYDLIRFPNETSTMWRSKQQFVVPSGNYYARILGRTRIGTDFAIYAFPAFESVAEPSRFLLSVYRTIF